MEEFLYFLCHDCHKILTKDDVMGTDIPVGSELVEEGCVKCSHPSEVIEYDWLKNPLYKCKCEKLIFIVIPNLFQCNNCQANYESMIALVSDILTKNHVDLTIRVLDIYERIIQCNNFHNIAFSRDIVYEYVKNYIDA